MARTFYQNPAINPATMNFNFAHVYSNRQEMEDKKRTDGVYPGRYVLIEYEKEFEPIVKDNNGKWDFNNSYSYKKLYALEYVVEDETAQEVNYIPNNVTRVTYNGVRYDISGEADSFLTSVKENESKVVLYSDHVTYDDYDIPIGVTKGMVVAVGNLEETAFNFYQVIEGINGEPAQFKLLNLSYKNDTVYIGEESFHPITDGEKYAFNYTIDRAWAEKWGATIGRGYDSTVWQKTIVNGELTYVQIAELNTIIPTFDLLADAPKDKTEAPYFDEISSNVYYRLHNMANWGMRIKEANPNAETSSDLITYPSNVREDGTDLAIYWNNDGFDKININKDTVHNNKINIANTGISGESYSDTNGPTEDIKEISIMLPALGNTISDIWDIIYGDINVNEAKSKREGHTYNNTREDDIQWYNANASEQEKTKGLRLVAYNIGPDETYNYQPDEVETLAGCINSIHDLMGMIIYPSPNENPINMQQQEVIDELSSDYIYYINNKYWRRGIKTEFTSEYDEDDLYRLINVIPYDENDKYFYKDLTNFKRLIGNPNDKIPYYQFNDEENDMQLIEGLSRWDPTDHTIFYVGTGGSTQTLIRETEGLHDNRDYYRVNFNSRYIAFYDPEKYYIPNNPNEPISETNRRHPEELTPEANTRYYYLYKYFRVNEETHNVEYVDAYQGILGQDLTVFQPWKYYIPNEDGVSYSLITTSNIPFYNDTPGVGETVNLKRLLYERISMSDLLRFYVGNKYYYKFYIGDPEDGIYDYYLDANANPTEGRNYYDLVRNPIQVDRFYKPNEFYYENNGRYELDHSQNYTNNRNYYENLKLYVISDETNQFRIGSEWNQNVEVPQGIEVGIKENKYTWYELTGFARGLNTIHGMLLKINALLNTDDDKAIDTDTVQGCINALKDRIDLFGEIYPNSILLANEVGKVVTGSLSGDNWTSLSAAAGPQLQVRHLGQASTKTTSTTDLNSTNGNTVVLLDVTTDTKGHVTAESRTTVTLPNSYGSISGDSGTVSSSDSTDTLTIAGDSSLISTSAVNNTLTITHETHTVTPDNTPTSSLSSTSTVPSVVIHQYGYDGAGHITSETNTTVSGVASYGIITGDNNTSTTASASLDTLAITGDTWIGTSAASDAITLTHKAPATVTPTAQSNDTPSFGSTFSITDWHFDSTGHKDGSSTHTVTIPQGSLVDDNIEYGTSANVLTGINFTASSGRIGYTHQNASALLLTGYNSAHNIVNPNGSIGDAFASIEGKFNTLENSISGNANGIDTLETAVNTINNTTIPNIVNTTIPNAVNSAVTTLIGGASDAFNTLKEIEDWISDGQTGVSALVTRVGTLESDLSDTNDSTVNGSLAYRVSALEADIGNLSGGGSGSVSSQISSAISTYDTNKNFGTVITHDHSEYETVGAAAAVQGNTQSTVKDIEDALGNYIKTSDTFTYDNSDPLDPVEMTVAQLVAYVKTLEDRIAILEGGGGVGGNEPEPQTPATPDVVIEFTQGVGSTTADFTDVLTNINGNNDLTYSVVVDNIELDLDQTTPVEIQQDNGNNIIVINLDDTTYEKVIWTNDGNDSFTLVSL